jgi:steroid delta-isomerase-like uncharacterized protein
VSEAYKQLAKRWFEEVWNQGRREAIGELLAPDTVFHEGRTATVGPEGFYPFFDCMQAAFSDIHITVHDAIAEGDKVCLLWSATMRHTGEGLGVPQTMEQLDITGISIVRIADNRLAERWQNWDMRGLSQLVYKGKLAQACTARTGGGEHLRRPPAEWIPREPHSAPCATGECAPDDHCGLVVGAGGYA